MKDLFGHWTESRWRLEMVAKYGETIADKIFYEFWRVEGDYECVDNWRDCNPYDKEDRAKYDNCVQHGCCGFADFQIAHGGQVYWFGFNYGH